MVRISREHTYVIGLLLSYLALALIMVFLTLVFVGPLGGTCDIHWNKIWPFLLAAVVVLLATIRVLLQWRVWDAISK